MISIAKNEKTHTGEAWREGVMGRKRHLRETSIMSRKKIHRLLKTDERDLISHKNKNLAFQKQDL
jgi:hypothetical protein